MLSPLLSIGTIVDIGKYLRDFDPEDGLSLVAS